MQTPAIPRALTATLVAASLALAACSALQIDVDVYKGPLINSEAVQKDQLISMAMSAKTLLFTVRNRFMETACGKEIWVDADDSRRRRVLDATEFVCKNNKEPSEESKRRTARRVNDILSFYDSKGSRFFRNDLDDLRSAHDRYKNQLEMYRAEPLKDIENKELEKLRKLDEYQKAHQELAEVLRSVVQVLAQAGRDETKLGSPDEADKARLSASSVIAGLTQPLLLACAAQLPSQAAEPWLAWFRDAQERARGQLAIRKSEDWSPKQYEAAREGIRKALETDPAAGAQALRKADQALKDTDEALLLRTCGNATEASQSARPLGVPSKNLQTLRATGPTGAVTNLQAWGALPKYFRQTGISQAPPTKDVDDSPEENRMERLLAGLATLGATGFDRGRIDDGIDKLADKYAALRDKVTRPMSASTKPERDRLEAAKGAADEAFFRLDHALVDLAGRMQFLAANAWLLGEMADFNNEKAALESIANNIIVHADDLRNRAAFNLQQTDSAAMEARAARVGFAQDAATSLRDIGAAIEAGRTRALAIENTSASSQTGTPLDTAKQALTQAEEQADDALALALTMPGLADIKLPSNKKLATDVEADRKGLQTALTGDGRPVDLETLRSDLSKWLETQGVEFTSLAQKDDPRGQRLAAAARAVTSLKPLGTVGQNSLPRKEALVALAIRVGALWERTQDKVKAKNTAEATAKKADTDAQKLKLAADELPFSSADYTATAKIVDEVKATALAQAKTSGAVGDGNLVMAQLRLAVDAASEKVSVAEKARYEKANAVLRSMAGATQIAPTSEARTRIEVVDSVTAQLRYRHLDSIRRLGVDAAETKQAAAALAAARKEREDNVFLRPSSTYLRAANAATIFQVDPSLRWKNMLIESATETVRSFSNTDRKSEFEAVRAGIDQAYWQNINKVKLGGAGSTNFVVAKDDVGNWYVKAMGTNPEAMVKAATNLALFNMGSGFNTDLLRVNTLREKIDTTSDANKRTEMRTELDGLTSTKSGPATGARATTLSLFQGNYDALSKAHLSSLASKLEADEFRIKILERWKATLKDALTPTALDKAMDSDQPMAKHRAALDAAKADPAIKTGQSILATLQALQGLRSTLKATVQATPALTEKEVMASAVADKAVEDGRSEADRLAGLLVAAVASLQVKESASVAAADKDPAAKAQAEKERSAAAADVSRRSDELKAANIKLSTDQTTAASKRTALTAARDRQKAAATDVDTVLKGAIDEIVTQRLRAVDETETAVKVIGRSNQ